MLMLDYVIDLSKAVRLTGEKMCMRKLTSKYRRQLQAPMKGKNDVFELLKLHIRKMINVRTNT